MASPTVALTPTGTPFTSGPGFPNQGSPPAPAPASPTAAGGHPPPAPGVSAPPNSAATSQGGMPPNAASGAGLPGASPGPGNGHGTPDPTKINPYIYTPSFSMAIIGASAFVISFAIHLGQLIKTKAWYFSVFTQAVLLSAVGMVARAHSVVTLKETGATGPFVISMMMENTAPTMVAIGIIMTYTRLIWWVTPNEKRTFSTLWSPPKHTSLMWGGFVAIADITKAVAQNVLKHTDPVSMKIQEVAQIAQFFIFFGLTLIMFRFMRMSRKWLIHGAVEEKRWRSLGWTCVASSAILAARHIFTIVAMDARADPKGFWSLHEWVYWLAEPIPLFIIFCLFNNSFPGHFFPRDFTGFRLKLKVIEKAKMENPWPLTISHPIRNDDFFTRQDDKGVEVRLTELESGKRY